jgi:hypothetical protein
MITPAYAGLLRPIGINLTLARERLGMLTHSSMLQNTDNEILKDARWDEQGFYVSWESIIPLREHLVNTIFALQSGKDTDILIAQTRQLLKEIGVNLAP